jgi:hypothetical protein
MTGPALQLTPLTTHERILARRLRLTILALFDGGCTIADIAEHVQNRRRNIELRRLPTEPLLPGFVA